jgi:NhaA family Na+:H+ antiporter
VHATIAGILLAFLLPSSLNLEHLEHALHKWSAFAILPLFALANAGVSLSPAALADAANSRVTWGVVLGLVVGKLIGIPLFAYLTARLGLGELPPQVGMRQVVGVSGLAGIGFTVSLFITGLAFTDARLADAAKVGIVAASILAAAMGMLVLRSGGEHRA